jgi:hypothetical protein
MMSSDVVGKKKFTVICVALALVLFAAGWWIGAMSPIIYMIAISILMLAVIVILRLGAWVAVLVLAAHLYLVCYLGNMLADGLLDWLMLAIIPLSLIMRGRSLHHVVNAPTLSVVHPVHSKGNVVHDQDNHSDHGLSSEDGNTECDIENVTTEKMPETPQPRQFLPHQWLASLTPGGRRLFKSPFPF